MSPFKLSGKAAARVAAVAAGLGGTIWGVGKLLVEERINIEQQALAAQIEDASPVRNNIEYQRAPSDNEKSRGKIDRPIRQLSDSKYHRMLAEQAEAAAKRKDSAADGNTTTDAAQAEKAGKKTKWVRKEVMKYKTDWQNAEEGTYDENWFILRSMLKGTNAIKPAKSLMRVVVWEEIELDEENEEDEVSAGVAEGESDTDKKN